MVDRTISEDKMLETIVMILLLKGEAIDHTFKAMFSHLSLTFRLLAYYTSTKLQRLRRSCHAEYSLKIYQRTARSIRS